MRSPEISWSFGGQYEVDLASAGTLTLSANYYYNDGYFFDPQNRVEQPSYSLVNAAVTWKPNETYSIMLWGKNLTDEERITQVDVILPTGDDYFPEAPRTYGVTLRAEF